ncbi:hypothetical protein [Priestia koreensis]|uniref:hypothetical protein n=1 Tax=Priestia koreensis TaxID=284581 RepID=UPI0028F74F0F|nr:hypothetical protein [Priestia koreensis]
MSEPAEIPQEKNDEEAQRSPRGKRSNLKLESALFSKALMQKGKNSTQEQHSASPFLMK